MAGKQAPRPEDGNSIWDRYFKVRVPYLRSRSVESIRKYGIRVSGIEEFDKTVDKQMIDTEMTIDTMFEKWRSGVTVRVVNYNDTAEIYRIIHCHLIAWAEYLSSAIHIADAPLQDLIELDKFAEVVYDKAVSVFAKEERETAIASNFTNIQAVNFKNILKRQADGPVTRTRADGVEVTSFGKKEEEKILPRNSLKDIFTDQINQLSGWRNNE